ncbi:MAG: hypothetical protein WDM81_07335 [Rhizomicrobium sp.]
MVQRLFTRDPSGLAPGQALKALWLGDGGGVRGAGVVARQGRQSYLLVSAAQDADWIADAAARFGVAFRDVTEEEGGLAIAGPYAAKLVAALGLDPVLDLSAFRKETWKGLDITLSRFGELAATRSGAPPRMRAGLGPRRARRRALRDPARRPGRDGCARHRKRRAPARPRL